MKKVITVILAYNEEKTIEKVVNGASRYSDGVLVVLAEKSSDRTKEILDRIKATYILDHGKGHGEAKRCAIDHVKDGIIIFMDADGSHDPKDIPKLVKPILNGEADMVIGSRMRGGSDELYGSFSNFARMWGANLVQLIINYRFGVRLSDCENGFRALDVVTAKNLHLNANDFDIEEEMVLKALKKRYRVTEVPTHEYARLYGKSNIKLPIIGWKFVWRLIREIW